MSMMKLPLAQTEGTVSTTTTVKNKSDNSISQNRFLFNCIDKLAANHDVTVSNSMIKVTYKKALKDQYASFQCENGLNFMDDSVLSEKKMNTLNNSGDFSSKGVVETPKNISNMYSKDFVLVPTNAESSSLKTKSLIFHSTPKQDGETVKKKNKEYVNGLDLIVRLNNGQVKDSVSNNYFKVHNNSLPGMNLSKELTSLKKPSAKNRQRSSSLCEVNRTDTFQAGNKRFLKDVTLVKLKDSIKAKLQAVDNKSKAKDALQFNKAGNDKKPQNKIKRKMKIEENVVPHKQSRKSSGTQQTSGKRKSISNGPKVVVKDKMVKLSAKKDKSNEKIEESSSCRSRKRELLREDPELPPGWKRFIRTKYEDTVHEKHIVYILSPEGRKFQFKWKLRKYLEKSKSPLNADQFHFGLYKKSKSGVDESDVPAVGKEDKKKESKVHSSTVTNKTSGKVVDAEGKKLLLHDPDLPFGWKRIINSNNSDGRKQVHIISPEGRIFRRRYRLSEYLTKHQYTHNLDRFYFGLYPKKDSGSESPKKSADTDLNEKGLQPTIVLNRIPDDLKSNNRSITTGEKLKKGKGTSFSIEIPNLEKNYPNVFGNKKMRLILKKIDEDNLKANVTKINPSLMKVTNTSTEIESSINVNGNKNDSLPPSVKDQPNGPMFDDPNLPAGWKRLIKTRSFGETAGRMEVVIVSPDGKKHRTKRYLERYLKENNLDHKIEDFSFSVFGKAKQECTSTESKDLNSNLSGKSGLNAVADEPVPGLDVSRVNDVKVTREGEMINEVSALAVLCGVSSMRSERRSRLPRSEHEKILKNHLDLESDASNDGCDIMTYWIQKLVKCRSDIRFLEADGASAVAEKTKEFIKEMTRRAFQSSRHPETGLTYEDVADLVEKSQCLSPLKTLIPQKITFKEYIRLNRPKRFLSFT